MTPAELRDLLAAATPTSLKVVSVKRGPHWGGDTLHEIHDEHGMYQGFLFDRETAVLIVALRNSADNILDRLEAAEAENKQLYQLLVNAWNDGEHANFCFVEQGEEVCICWRAEVDAYLKSVAPRAAALSPEEHDAL